MPMRFTYFSATIPALKEKKKKGLTCKCESLQRSVVVVQ